MTAEFKQSLLLAVYEAYDKVARGYRHACRRDCSSCCTHNVIATSVEAALVLDHSERLGLRFAEAFDHGMTTRRYTPALTVNTLAGYCLRREEPPSDEREFDTGPCPLREDEGCPIYAVRPFACRSMWSLELCRDDHEAVMDPLLVTVNGVFQQIIEDLDRGGLYGNLTDLVEVLMKQNLREAFRAGQRLRSSGSLIENVPNQGFLVPPGHRAVVVAALNVLWETRVAGLPFREALGTVQQAAKA